jgi:Arm DNA-binding domain
LQAFGDTVRPHDGIPILREALHRARGGAFRRERATGFDGRQAARPAPLRRERTCKVSDEGNGLYVVIAPSGSRSFRYDYRRGGRRETPTIGRHEPVARCAQRCRLAYDMDGALEEARLLLTRARVDVRSGRSPARAKVEHRSEVVDAMSFGRWATR